MGYNLGILGNQQVGVNLISLIQVGSLDHWVEQTFTNNGRAG